MKKQKPSGFALNDSATARRKQRQVEVPQAASQWRPERGHPSTATQQGQHRARRGAARPLWTVLARPGREARLPDTVLVCDARLGGMTHSCVCLRVNYYQ